MAMSSEYRRSFLSLSAKRWRRLPVSLRVGIVLIAFHLAVAAIGPFLVPYGFAQIGVGAPMSGASWQHPFGVDLIGRDVFSRTVHGSKIVLMLALSSTALGAVGGIFVGLLSAYLGGWIDEIIQRLLEALISIPFLILALLLVSIIGPQFSSSPISIVFVVAFIYLPRIARIARAAALDIVKREHVIAARLRGETALQIVRYELLPNAAGTLVVECSLRAAYAPVLIGALGFLGFGLRPPTPEWGLMISENRQLLFTDPMTVVGPGLALASLVVGINMFADGLARLLGYDLARVGE